MCDDTFAFIIHPIDPKRDVARKFPTLGKLPAWLIDYLSLFFPPVYISEIKGVRSQDTGRQVRGWFLACPLTPKRMMSLPPTVVYRKIVETGRLAERLGARLLGLGAFTSVVGDGGLTVSRHLSIPVTTGDSYTVVIAVQAVRQAAVVMNSPLDRSTLAIVGATGTIGSLCARMLAGETDRLILVGRRAHKLAETAEQVRAAGARKITTTDDLRRLTEAHHIITVTSALDAIIEPHYLRPGAVVCDVSRPRDISPQVARQRPDVLVIEGGMVRVPGDVDFGFNFGFPPQMAYACMAETMALALDQQYVPFSLGRALTLSQASTIDKIAHRHGFRLGGFRSFERAVTETDIESVLTCVQSMKLGHEDGVPLKNHPAVDPVPS